jgi:hypothetical protein
MFVTLREAVCSGRRPTPAGPGPGVLKEATMRAVTKVGCVCGLAVLAAALSAGPAHAQYGRQYYGGWSYYPQYNYYFCPYYYQPYVGYSGYEHHYAIYYPAYPSYVYYYNPYRHYYWGRLDLKAKGENKYSLLAEKDRKENLKDIPDKAFPKLEKMPNIPGSKDNVQMEPVKDLPKLDKK